MCKPYKDSSFPGRKTEAAEGGAEGTDQVRVGYVVHTVSHQVEEDLPAGSLTVISGRLLHLPQPQALRRRAIPLLQYA